MKRNEQRCRDLLAHQVHPHTHQESQEVRREKEAEIKGFKKRMATNFDEIHESTYPRHSKDTKLNKLKGKARSFAESGGQR